MRTIKLLFLFLLLFSNMAFSNTEAPINKLITSWMATNKVPGVAVELYVNGKPHAYYYGIANQDKHIPVTSQTIFEIGSVTKLFTSLLVALEVNAGQIKLPDPALHYLVPARKPPFFKNLLSHFKTLILKISFSL